MKLSVAVRRYRLPLLVFLTLVFLTFAIWFAHTPGQPRSVKDFVFIMQLLGGPFLVFAYIVWSSTNWSDMAAQGDRGMVRTRLALVGLVMGAASAILLFLSLPLWDTAIDHPNLQELWVFAGMLLAVAATACGIFGAPKLRRPAIISVLLLPCWFLLAALLLKARLD